MGERALWPVVAVVTVLTTAITVMMALNVDVTAVALVFSLMGNIAGGLISVMVYGKVMKVETNTNGNLSNQQDLVRQLVDHLRNSSPRSEGE